MGKNKRKLLFTIFILLIILLSSFFLNKDLLIELKDTAFKEIKKVIEDETGKSEKIELTDDLMVFFLDVGQADSILIKSNEEYMLIDAGNNSDGKKLIAFFNTLGIKEFKYVIGTHAHEDHIGGMDDIIKNFKIKNFYMPSATTTTQSFYEVLDALEKNNIAFKTPEIGTKLKLGKSNIEVLYVDSENEDLNDTSIVVRLSYGDISFLFMADATSNAERKMLDKNIKSTVLKVGHHGSKYSSSAVFLNKVKPKYAIISCEKNNDYYHPHDVVLNKLKKLKTEIYRTDLLGTIVATSDGKNISFKYLKTDTNGE